MLTFYSHTLYRRERLCLLMLLARLMGWLAGSEKYLNFQEKGSDFMSPE
jgi:hypothetical protein